MWRKSFTFCLSVALLLLLNFGCNKPVHSSAAPPENTPEEVYRSFMIASLAGEESAIRPLILDHEGTPILWQSPYPPAAAALLGEQYRTMEISRAEDADNESPDRVVLQSMAVPFLMEMVKVNGAWKLNTAPLVAFRKQAAEFSNQQSEKN